MENETNNQESGGLDPKDIQEIAGFADEEKAFKFHDMIFKKQSKLRNGEKFLKAEAKALGVNMSRLAKDIKSDKVMKRIEEDMAEARKFNIQGTPGFVLNGIPVKGAYPLSYFEKIVDKLKEKNMVSL